MRYYLHEPGEAFGLISALSVSHKTESLLDLRWFVEALRDSIVSGFRVAISENQQFREGRIIGADVTVEEKGFVLSVDFDNVPFGYKRERLIYLFATVVESDCSIAHKNVIFRLYCSDGSSGCVEFAFLYDKNRRVFLN